MKRLQFITLLAWPKLGWLQDVRVQRIDWGRRWLVALGGMTYMLLSSSYGQGSVRQRVDAASGQQLFHNACRTCHTTKEGDNRLGPHLYQIIGRKAGSLPDYGYSSAMKGADFVWDEQKLKCFLANPDELVPGNNMKPHGGLASPDDRAKIVSFLRSVASGH
jgi:cytochrome c